MPNLRNVSLIVHQHLCMGCGICKDACPAKCISIRHTATGIFPTVDESACKNCGVCLKSCPGKGVKLVERGNQLFPSANKDRYVGACLQPYIGYSKDQAIRLHSASGGQLRNF